MPKPFGLSHSAKDQPPGGIAPQGRHDQRGIPTAFSARKDVIPKPIGQRFGCQLKERHLCAADLFESVNAKVVSVCCNKTFLRPHHSRAGGCLPFVPIMRQGIDRASGIYIGTAVLRRPRQPLHIGQGLHGPCPAIMQCTAICICAGASRGLGRVEQCHGRLTRALLCMARLKVFQSARACAKCKVPLRVASHWMAWVSIRSNTSSGAPASA